MEILSETWKAQTDYSTLDTNEQIEYHLRSRAFLKITWT